jgi:hypothetical protein
MAGGIRPYSQKTTHHRRVNFVDLKHTREKMVSEVINREIERLESKGCLDIDLFKIDNTFNRALISYTEIKENK